MHPIRCSRRLKICTGSICLLLIIKIVLCLHFFHFWETWSQLDTFLEDSKCPLCYGVDRCSDFYSKKARVYNSFENALTSYINNEKVYRGYYWFSSGTILKKLAHNAELKKLEAKACRLIDSKRDCDFKEILKLDLTEKMLKMVKYQPGLTNTNGLTICPDANGLLELTKPFYVNPQPRKETMLNIWTILNLNAEPILLKFLNAYKGDWPVAKYYGACGRIVLESSEGYSIRLTDNWLNRVSYAIDMLQIADKFTFGHYRFRFYLTDITLDNFVIKDINSRFDNIRIINMENVIVVDKMSQKVPVDWKKTNHTSEVIPCKGCFAFSTEKICGHFLSDHNHYSICKLLQDEVLADVPKLILQVSPFFNGLVSNCVEPTRSADRFIAAKSLIDELQKILKVLQDNKRDSGTPMIP